MALDTQVQPEPTQPRHLPRSAPAEQLRPYPRSEPAEQLRPYPRSEPAELRLADGIELLGEYRGSGFNEPPYLIQRADGHNVQVSRLVYLVAEAITETHDAARVGALVSRRYGRHVSADNVRYLVERKLTPVGIARAADGDQKPLPRADPLLALRLRVPLVPERVHRAVTTALRPLFWPPIVAATLTGLALTDLWLLTSQRSRIAEGMRTILFEPHLLLALTLLTLVAGAFHEMGHAAAARYGGARPGAMGAGVYLVWPVFYTDVSDTYRLDRRGRLRTDLGGVYFNVLFVVAAVWSFAASGSTPLLVLAVFLQFETLRQFLPFVRLDGYYVVSDLAGVPNLFSYMGPVLQVVARRRDSEPRRQAQRKLQELTRRARVLIVGWVVVTAPVLVGNLVLFLFLLPRLAGMAWGSAGTQLREMTGPGGSISPVGVANGVVSLVLLALPVAGISYLLVMVLKRAARLASRWRHRRPAVTGACTLLAGCALVVQVGVVWPDTFATSLARTRQQSGQPAGRPHQIGLADLPLGLPFYGRPSPAAIPIPQRVMDQAAGPPTDTTTEAASGVPGPTPVPEPPLGTSIGSASSETTPPPGGTGGGVPAGPTTDQTPGGGSETGADGTTPPSGDTTTTVVTDPPTTTVGGDGQLLPSEDGGPGEGPQLTEWERGLGELAAALRHLLSP